METDTKTNSEMNKESIEVVTEENDAITVSNDSKSLDAITKHNIEAIAQNNKDVIIANLAVLNEYRTFAESLKDTNLGQRFAENVTVNGKVVSIVNIDNMVTCLLIGKELKLSPMVALSYGNSLNLDAIQKIELGNSLGFSTTASLKNIYVFGVGEARQVYTGINAIESCLNKHKIDIVIDEDFVPVYTWINVQLNKPIIEFNSDRHIDIDCWNDVYVKKAMSEKGCIPVTRIIKTFKTSVTLIRNNKPTHVSYTLQEAIDAGLKSGINSITGAEVKGKDNWDKFTRSLMRKMPIMIAARICANDVINGMYCDFELKDVKSIPTDESYAQTVYAEVVND